MLKNYCWELQKITWCANFPKKITFTGIQTKPFKEPSLTYVEISADLAPKKKNFAWFSDGQCSIVALAKKAQGIDLVV